MWSRHASFTLDVLLLENVNTLVIYAHFKTLYSIFPNGKFSDLKANLLLVSLGKEMFFYMVNFENYWQLDD